MPVTKPLNSHANIKQLTDSDSPSSGIALSRLMLMYDAIVGTSAQVADGSATHTSLATAISSLPSAGGAVYIMVVTITENVTISGSNIRVVGKGHPSVLNGNLTVSGSYNDIDSFKIAGNLTVSGNNNFVKSWIASTSTASDSGLGNDLRVSQE